MTIETLSPELQLQIEQEKNVLEDFIRQILMQRFQEIINSSNLEEKIELTIRTQNITQRVERILNNFDRFIEGGLSEIQAYEQKQKQIKELENQLQTLSPTIARIQKEIKENYPEQLSQIFCQEFRVESIHRMETILGYLRVLRPIIVGFHKEKTYNGKKQFAYSALTYTQDQNLIATIDQFIPPEHILPIIQTHQIMSRQLDTSVDNLKNLLEEFDESIDLVIQRFAQLNIRSIDTISHSITQHLTTLRQENKKIIRSNRFFEAQIEQLQTQLNQKTSPNPTYIIQETRKQLESTISQLFNDEIL